MSLNPFELNQKSWNYNNGRQNHFKGSYADAIRSGEQVVPNDILELLALSESDTLVHLMCNDGREVAYFSQMVGCCCAGVDFSEPAIAFALDLNESLGFENVFTVDEVHHWLSTYAGGRFSVVYLSPGSIRWIPDLHILFDLISKILLPDGKLFLWDFHPLLSVVDPEFRLTGRYPIQSETAMREFGVTNYAESPADYVMLSRNEFSPSEPYDNPHKVWFTKHSIGAILNAGVQKGFRLLGFEELTYMWEEKYFTVLEPGSNRDFRVNSDSVRLPMLIVVQFLRCAEHD